MSLETLLEAVEWVESTGSKGKTREDSSRHFHPYAKSPTNVSDDNSDDRGTEDMREKRRTGGAGTREVHNKLEKNRRAHLKECFDALKLQIPHIEDRKTSNLSILRSALKYIQTLRRKERENELEVQKLAQEKSQLRERMEKLQTEVDQLYVRVDLQHFMQSSENAELESNSTSTATEGPNSQHESDEEIREVRIIQQTPASFNRQQQKPLQAHPSVVQSPQHHIAKAIPIPVIRTMASVAPTSLISRPQVAQTPGNQTTPLNLVVATTASTGVTAHTPVQQNSVPVTQLLQKALEKRQAHIKQNTAHQVTAISANPVARPTVTTMPVAVSQALTAAAVGFPPMVSIMSAAQIGGTKVGNLTLTNPGKVSQSILLTSTAQNLPAGSNHGHISAQVPAGSSNLGAAAELRNSNIVTSVCAAPTLISTPGHLARPMLTAAVQGAAGNTAQVLTASPLTFGHPQLLAQLPRGATLPGMGVGMGGLPLVSIGAGGTQIMSPLTVMAPGLFSAPLLKQFPLIQSPQLLSGAQVLQQPQQSQQSVVSPLMVVSMPSIVTSEAQSRATAPQSKS